MLHACSYLAPRYTLTVQVNTTYAVAVSSQRSHACIGIQYIRKNQNRNRNISALLPSCDTKPCAISYIHAKLPSCQQLYHKPHISHRCALLKILKIHISNTHTYTHERAISVRKGVRKSAEVLNAAKCMLLPSTTLQTDGSSKHTYSVVLSSQTSHTYIGNQYISKNQN